MTTLGYRIVPVIARVKPGFALTLNTARSRRRLRGAARLPDGPDQRAAPFARLAGHDAALLRHHLRRALHLGRDGGYFAQSLRSDLSMIRPVLTEVLLFLTPFVLYAVFLWATQAGVLDLNSWPLARVARARHRRAAAGARQLRLFRAFHRRAAGLDLRAGAYGGRQIRAGDDQVMAARTAAPTASSTAPSG